MMKKYAVVRIVICSIVALVLIAALCVGLYWYKNGSPGFDFSWGGVNLGGYTYKNSEDYSVGGGMVEAAGIENVEIHWISGSVSVIAGQGSDIVLSEDAGLSEEDRLRYLVSGNTLIVQFCAPRVGIYSMDDNKNLEVVLPESMMESLQDVTVESVSAEGEIRNIFANSCDIDNVSGEWDVRGCGFETMDLDTVSGGAALSSCTINRLDMDTVSGDLKAELVTAPQRIKMNSVSGDLEVSLPEGTGFRAEMDSVSGDVESDMAMSKKNGQYLCGDGFTEIEMDSVSGDLWIRGISAA